MRDFGTDESDWVFVPRRDLQGGKEREYEIQDLGEEKVQTKYTESKTHFFKKV